MSERTAYTVTACRACEGCTALVVEPDRYVCVGCGETGTVGAGGYGNVPDERPDPTLAVVLAGVLDASPSMKEFRSLCTLHRLRYPKLKEAARARPLA